MRLAISKSSFHYRYYEVLRALWGINKCRDKVTSLCTYSQFVFWMTIATVIASPFLILGWTLLKLGRFFYKILSLTSIGRAVIDFLDSIFGIGGLLEDISNKMIDNPMSVLCGFAFCVIALTSLIVGVPLVLIVGFGTIITIFWNFVVEILGLIYSLGVLLFYFSTLLSVCAIYVWLFLSLVASIVWTFLTGVGIWISYIGIALFVGSLFSLILVKIALSIDKVNQFIMFKINGFHSARSKNKARRDEICKKRVEEQKEREEIRKALQKEREEIANKKATGKIEYTVVEKIEIFLAKICSKFFIGLWNIVKTIFGFLFSRTKQVGNGTVKVMGIFSLLWNVLVSIKQGVCPFVEFVEEEELK